jgi:hypothetical protein
MSAPYRNKRPFIWLNNLQFFESRKLHSFMQNIHSAAYIAAQAAAPISPPPPHSRYADVQENSPSANEEPANPPP